MAKSADEYWATLCESGWLTTIPKSRHSLLRQEIARVFATEPRDVFEVLAAGRDTPFYRPADYKRQLREYAAVSRGAFRPSDISVSYSAEDDTVTLSFRFRRRRFSQTIAYQDSEAFLSFIHDTLAEFGIKERYHWLPCKDETGCGLVFVEPALHERALDMNLIPDHANYFEWDWYLESPRRKRGRRRT